MSRRFFESPHPATYFLLSANIVIYALCVNRSGLTSIPPELLLRNGAMYTAALERHEYWRLVAAGFLHANLIHLFLNMLCLALWGGHLEKRVGASYFALVYVGAMVAGSVTSNLAHTTPYLSVGASGAISGVLGALLCLRILAKNDLPLNFFVINIGLNVAMAFSARNIDWVAHVGGFVAGMAGCALLDLIEKANRHVLRCKFPEFAKLNLLLLVAGSLLLLWLGGGSPAAYGAACAGGLAAAKLVDVVLSLRRGLALVVVGLAVANGALALMLAAVLAPAGCAVAYAPMIPQMRNLLGALCANVPVTTLSAAAGAVVLTILLYSQELMRGAKDIGFVSAGMTGERKRRYGL